MSERNFFKLIYKNNLFIMILMFIVLIVYSKSFILHSSIINEISSLFSANNDTNITYFVQVLTGVQFQVISRFFTIFFSLYAVSFLLWLISRIDEIIFDPKEGIRFSLFTQSYLYSLYILIADLLFQTFYMNLTNNEIPISVLPYYNSGILLLQTSVFMYFLGVKKHKLYITSIVWISMISIISFLFFYYSEVLT